jgi:hypothetical protein
MLFAEWSSGEWIAVIGAIGTQIVTFAGVVIAYLKTRDNSKKIVEVAAQHQKISDDVQKIEVATNSMKDLLVQKAGEAGELKGRDEERNRQKNDEKKP